MRLACRTRANESPNQPSVMALYWAKYLFGLIEEGDTPVDEMRPLQPWPTGEYAEALELGAGR